MTKKFPQNSKISLIHPSAWANIPANVLATTPAEPPVAAPALCSAGAAGDLRAVAGRLDRRHVRATLRPPGAAFVVVSIRPIPAGAIHDAPASLAPRRHLHCPRSPAIRPCHFPPAHARTGQGGHPPRHGGSCGWRVPAGAACGAAAILPGEKAAHARSAGNARSFFQKPRDGAGAYP